LLEDEGFIERHRTAPKHFIRDRVLTFKIVFLLLISNLKESIGSEMGTFFGKVEKSDLKAHRASGSAFGQARMKLKHTAFVEMNDLQVAHFYQTTEYKTWSGHRLVAVDGSSLRLPSTKSTQKEFGINEEKDGKKIVMGRISEAFDPLNHITLDAEIAPFTTSEQEMMVRHLEKMGPGDLAIYDRNYPSFWAYKLHQSRGVDFCFRIQTSGRGKYITDFLESGEREAVVEIKATNESKSKCRELGLGTKPIKCRLVRIELSSGETEVLVTSLLDTETYPYGCFKALYHLRWPVEEDYKLLKCRIGLGNFSGKSALAVYQDFHAKIFSANLTSILAFDAGREIEEKKAGRKYTYKVNWNNAVQNFKNSGPLLFIRDGITALLDGLHLLFQVNPVPVRDDRTFVRKKSTKNRTQFHMCYK